MSALAWCRCSAYPKPHPQTTCATAAPMPVPDVRDLVDIEYLCEVMHNAYETAAAANGWETQQRSRVPWPKVPEANKRAMRAAVIAVLAIPAIATALGLSDE